MVSFDRSEKKPLFVSVFIVTFSIFMNIKAFLGSAQKAHMITVEPVGPLARLPEKNKIRHFSDFNRLNRLT
jgi:hypothetical protein